MNSRTVKYLSALFLCLFVVMSLQLRAQVTGATLSGTIRTNTGSRHASWRPRAWSGPAAEHRRESAYAEYLPA
jgi:hypothetical protein